MSSLQYRFRIVSGPESGRTFTVDAQGALIGRSESSDITIQDPAMSRDQCRVFLRDGLLWIADLKSSNDTLVDNEPVQEAPLWKDRRITIGESVILVESDGSSPRGNLEAARQGFARITMRQRIVLVALLVFFAVLFIPKWRKSPEPPADALRPAAQTVTAMEEPVLTLDYYRTQDHIGNVTELHFVVQSSGQALIRLEDMQADKSLQKTARIPTYQKDVLIHHLSEAGFFTLPSAGQTGPGADTVRITASTGSQTNTVTQALDGTTATFQQLCRNIEQSATSVFGAWVQDYSDENLEMLAAIKYETALELTRAEQTNYFDRLYEATALLQEAQWLVASLTEKPAFAAELPNLIARYQQELDQHLRELFTAADRAGDAGNTADAITTLETILRRIPDRSDSRYQTAADQRAAYHEQGTPTNTP